MENHLAYSHEPLAVRRFTQNVERWSVALHIDVRTRERGILVHPETVVFVAEELLLIMSTSVRVAVLVELDQRRRFVLCKSIRVQIEANTGCQCFHDAD